MTATVDFTLDLDQIEFADGTFLTAFGTADIESDAAGSYFKLTGLRIENMRVDRANWRWAALVEWIAEDARKPLGFVCSAHPEADTDAASMRGDFERDHRMNEAA